MFDSSASFMTPCFQSCSTRSDRPIIREVQTTDGLITSLGESTTLLNDDLTLILKWFIYTALCQSINIFGIVTNIINIICFVKQGFSEPINISLFGLAMSDIGCLSTLVSINIYMNPSFNEQSLPFDATEFGYMTASIPNIAFTRVTAWITAIITLERCLCITAPLKVKRIVTNKRVAATILIIFLTLLVSVAPIYVVHRLDFKFFPERNITLLGLVYTGERDTVEKVSYAINNVLIPGSAFLLIIVCTTTLVIKLHTRTKWRKQTTGTTQADNVSARNQRVAKMVVMISITFISCFIPFSVIFIAMSMEPELSIDGQYKNTLAVVGGLGLVLESINSSANIFIYYNMSSKYRIKCRQLLRMNVNESQDGTSKKNQRHI